MKEFFGAQGFVVTPTASDRFATFVAAEVKTWVVIVKTTVLPVLIDIDAVAVLDA